VADGRWRFQIFHNSTYTSSLAAQTEVNRLAQHALAGPVIFPKGETLLRSIYLNIILVLEFRIYVSYQKVSLLVAYVWS